MSIRKQVTRLLTCMILTVTAMTAGSAFASDAADSSVKTLQDLLAAGQLEIGSSITPADALVPGQKATLTIQVATAQWFTGGTRITVPEVAGLVILQTDQFASNASENRAGQSWVVQRWTLDVYPQREGEFTVPPIQLRLSVNGGAGGEVKGEAMSPSVSFRATTPPALADAQSWVASPRYTVTEDFDRSLEDLQIGDAFTREIVFEAEDIMAMMLPAFETKQQPGLAAYPDAPQLENNSNRGDVTARKRVSISYVVESEGTFVLPAKDYLWWDTRQQQSQLLSLPATQIIVGSGINPTSTTEAPDITASNDLRWQLLAAIILLSALTIWAARYAGHRARIQAAKAKLLGQWQRVKALRDPALPEQLNPGSSAGE